MKLTHCFDVAFDLVAFNDWVISLIYEISLLIGRNVNKCGPHVMMKSVAVKAKLFRSLVSWLVLQKKQAASAIDVLQTKQCKQFFHDII